MSILQEFSNIAESLVNPALESWTKDGKKVVGFFCSYLPEEILYAADIVPYRVRAAGCLDTKDADVYMSHLNCTFSKSCLQYLLEGQYKFLDGIAFTNTCDHTRRIYDILGETRPTDFSFMMMISCPRKVTDQSIDLYKKKLTEFKSKVEDYFQVEITNERLKKAVAVYNETRDLLKRLYELRRKKNPPLTGTQNMSVITAGTMMPKNEYNRMLKKLLEELGDAEGISGYKARFMIAGSGGCDSPDYYKTIEELGGLIVTDSLCIGTRYFWHPVETEGDLMENLACTYLKRPSCPMMVDGVVQRSEFIKEMCKSFKVDGVIYQTMRYCDLWGGSIFDVRKNLKASDIPLLELEREYMFGGKGQLRTRIQAFLENIGD